MKMSSVTVKLCRVSNINDPKCGMWSARVIQDDREGKDMLAQHQFSNIESAKQTVLSHLHPIDVKEWLVYGE